MGVEAAHELVGEQPDAFERGRLYSVATRTLGDEHRCVEAHVVLHGELADARLRDGLGQPRLRAEQVLGRYRVRVRVRGLGLGLEG